MSLVEAREPRAPWSRPKRMAAVVLWCSFIAGILSTLLLLMLGPVLDHDGRFSMQTLTLWFLLSWALSVAPIVFAAMLATAPASERMPS